MCVRDVDEPDGVGVNGASPFNPCLAREVWGTTVRVECVSSVSEDESDPTDGEGDGVLKSGLLDVLGTEGGGGLGIERAASISWLRRARSADLKC